MEALTQGGQAEGGQEEQTPAGGQPPPPPPHPPPLAPPPPLPPAGRRPSPFGGGNPFGGGGNPFAGRKLNSVKIEEKDRTLRPPNEIVDAEFVNREPISSIADAFEKWDAKLILVDFFAYSCTNCIRTIPSLRDMYTKFRGHGLEVIAFARPEFVFEGDVSNIRNWMKRNNIDYPVVTDNLGSNWKRWGVTGWPSHFLIQKDLRSQYAGKFVTSFMHVGDRNGHELVNQVQRLLGLNDLPEAAEFNHAAYTDVEVFLGKDHRNKNSGADGCGEKRACEVKDDAILNAWDEGMPEPQTGTYTIYGASWCAWCRKAKILMEMTKTDFEFIDMDQFGGAAAGKKALQGKKALKVPQDHNTMPMVFDPEGAFVGGYDDIFARFADRVEQKAIDSQAEASQVKYNKEESAVSIYQTSSDAWKLDGEAMTAQEEGSVLSFQASLHNAAESGIRMFVVVEPQPGNPGWVQVSGAEKLEVEFPGRYYMKSFVESQIEGKLTASKGMRLYVVWLSTEPYDEHAVQ